MGHASFTLSRLLVALGGPLNRVLVRGYGAARPALRQLRNRLRKGHVDYAEEIRAAECPAHPQQRKKKVAPEPAANLP